MLDSYRNYGDEQKRQAHKECPLKVVKGTKTGEKIDAVEFDMQGVRYGILSKRQQSDDQKGENKGWTQQCKSDKAKELFFINIQQCGQLDVIGYAA